ncbi:MAG TPA: zf-HC2 domain-containing protein [Thermoanaerobaculia bacterium]|jgi:hypothetical protein
MKRDLSEADVRAIRSQLEGERDHPDLERELFLYVDGTLPPERQVAIEVHLESCARCREDVADLYAVRPGDPQAVRRWPSYAAAAALLAALIGGGSLLMLREPAKPAAVATAKPLPLPAPQQTAPAPGPVPEPAVVAETPVPPAQRGYSRREWEKLVRAARAGSKLVMPAVLLSIRQGDEHLRGTQNESGPMHPTGIVVETQRPLFTWPKREGARAIISVYHGRREVARSEPRAEPRWKPNRDLPRGRTYTWEVEVEKEGQVEIMPAPPTPPAQFHVLESEALVELDEARRKHADDHLLLGILYAKAGLDDQAREELQRVAPGDAETARRLLADIDTWDSSQ